MIDQRALGISCQPHVSHAAETSQHVNNKACDFVLRRQHVEGNLPQIPSTLNGTRLENILVGQAKNVGG